MTDGTNEYRAAAALRPTRPGDASPARGNMQPTIERVESDQLGGSRKRKRTQDCRPKSLCLKVPETGLEPALYCYNQALKLLSAYLARTDLALGLHRKLQGRCGMRQIRDTFAL